MAPRGRVHAAEPNGETRGTVLKGECTHLQRTLGGLDVRNDERSVLHDREEQGEDKMQLKRRRHLHDTSAAHA